MKCVTGKDRVPLFPLIPLERPFAPMIEMSTACNFRCKFCPRAMDSEIARVGFERKFMKKEFIMRCIDELAEFPRSDKPFKLYYNGMGESIIHPDFIEMVEYAVSKDVFTSHIVRTNGSLFEPVFNQRLIDAGMTEVNISIEAVSEEGYRRIAGVKGMFDKIVAGVKDLHERSGDCRIYAKIIPLNTPDTDVDEFYRIFEPITDIIDVEYPMQWNNGMIEDSTAGVGLPEVTVNGDPLTPNIACPYIFYTLMINVDGIVHLCCFDWSTQVNVGDMRKNTLQEIWNGDKIKEFWRLHLSGNRFDNNACRDCQYIYGAPDFMSREVRNELLERLK